MIKLKNFELYKKYVTNLPTPIVVSEFFNKYPRYKPYSWKYF